MKIAIEVDLQPHEFDLATELLRTLNLLTEHVKVRGGPAAAAKLPNGIPASNTPVSAAPAPAASVPAAAPPQTAPPGPATPQDACRVFTEAISTIGSGQQLDAVAAEVGRVFSTSSLPPKMLQAEFLEAFSTVSFDQKLIATNQSVAPYMHLLPRLPDSVRDAIKQKAIAKVLAHLNQKRPINTRREEFYLQAEAFAVLSEMGFVTIDGAVQTIEKLMKNTEKRAAAITTLGKTVERCKDKLASANQNFLQSLFKVLDTVNEQQFQYDIEWINGNMQRQPPAIQSPQVPAPVSAAVPAAAIPQPVPAAAAPAGAAPVAANHAPSATPDPNRLALRLNVTGTFHSPSLGSAQGDGTFFTLGWDPNSMHLVSGGREVPVTVWSNDGKVVHAIESPGMYVCCIDVELNHQLIMVCGIYDPPTGPYRSRIALYDGRAGQGFAPRGDIMRQEVDMIAVVRALPSTLHLVTGESIRTNTNSFQEQISLYDVTRVMTPGRSGTAVDPIMVFQEHKHLVTCLAPLPSNPGLFVSGSRDYTVKLWDVRSGPNAVTTMGVPNGGVAATTHAEMVTCVDVAGDVVLSGSLDQAVAAWDLRGLGSSKPVAVAGPQSVCVQYGQAVPWANAGILKVSLDGSPLDKLAAVATVQGLYSVDFSGPTPMITAAGAYTADGSTPKQYNDIKWASKTGRLYASAGDGALIDILKLQTA